MKILAFDTTNNLSIALFEKEKLIDQRIISEKSKQAELLVLEIEAILHQHKIWYQNLAMIATTSGPGSFTGVRIGLSVARTIKIATNLPLILINSCEAIANKYRNISSQITVINESGMGDFFCEKFIFEQQQSYEQNSSFIKDQQGLKLLEKEEIPEFFGKEKSFLCGSGKKEISKFLQEKRINFFLSEEEDFISAELIGKLALRKFQKGESTTNLDPIYLRSPQISERKK